MLSDSIVCFYERKQDPKTDGFKLKAIWLKGVNEQNLALLKQVEIELHSGSPLMWSPRIMLSNWKRFSSHN
jgi:hypothetical protein